MVVATTAGDQDDAASRTDYLARADAGGRAPNDLWHAIANFPNGRILKAVADAIDAEGPALVVAGGQASMPSGVARRLVATARAERVLLVSGEHGRASAELIGAPSEVPCASAGPIAVSGAVVSDAPPGVPDEERCQALALRALSGALEDAGLDARARAVYRVAVVLASFLGSAPAYEYARLSGRDVTGVEDVVSAVARAARSAGLRGPFVPIVGMSGASTAAVAVAADMLALDAADVVAVCAADSIGAGLRSALGLLACTDQPFMADGGLGLVLERPDHVARRGGRMRRLLTSVELLAPVRRRDGVPADGGRLGAAAGHSPGAILMTGLLESDLAAARRLADRIWPSDECERHLWASTRPLGADAATALVRTLHRPYDVGIVSAHAYGGSGVLVSSPPAAGRAGG